MPLINSLLRAKSTAYPKEVLPDLREGDVVEEVLQLFFVGQFHQGHFIEKFLDFAGRLEVCQALIKLIGSLLALDGQGQGFLGGQFLGEARQLQ